MYTVKEIFPTLQGEGAQVGRAAVFLRFAGCNLWTGQVRDKSKAFCRFCDTDFVGYDGPGGGKFESAETLADAVDHIWHAVVEARTSKPYVVCTGGEPTLQLDAPLVEALHARGFMVALETNGTRPAPRGIDWICVSPKAGVPLAQREGNELKLVFPQIGSAPATVRTIELSALLPAAHGRREPPRKSRGCGALLPCSSTLAAFAANT